MPASHELCPSPCPTNPLCPPGGLGSRSPHLRFSPRGRLLQPRRDCAAPSVFVRRGPHLTSSTFCASLSLAWPPPALSSPPDVVRFALVPKNNTESFFLLNCSALTPQLKAPNFPVPPLPRVLFQTPLPTNPLFVKFDLSEAFYHVALHKNTRRLTTFRLDGRYY